MYFRKMKDLREDNDKLQSDIAKLLQITRQQYSLYETGKRTIPIDLLIKLAAFYNTSIDYIVGITNEIKPYPKTKETK